MKQQFINESKIGCKSKTSNSALNTAPASCLVLTIVMLPRNEQCAMHYRILFATAFSRFSFFVLLYKLILRLDELLWEGRTFRCSTGRSFNTCFVLLYHFDLVEQIVRRVRQESVCPKPSYLDSSCENDYLFKVV